MCELYDNISYFFFFFQAEDGIRDIGVTGVQTCALPILKKYLFLFVTMFFAVYTFAQTKDCTFTTSSASKFTHLVVTVRFQGLNYNVIDKKTGKNKHFGDNQDRKSVV